MFRRCYLPDARGYKDYGGRGIRVCERWADFGAFVQDMGPRPEGTTIDRINGNGNYEPGNCRWATTTEQALNRRGVVVVEHNGELKPLCDWARIHGIDYRTVRGRLRLGWSLERALTTPPGPNPNAPKQLPPEQIAEACRLHDAHLSLSAIQQKLGLSWRQVRKAIGNPVPKRRRHER